jgi:hypothetical protein
MKAPVPAGYRLYFALPGTPAQCPLRGRKTGAPAPEAGLPDLADDGLGSDFQSSDGPEVAVVGEVVIDLLGIYQSAVAQHHADLRLEHRQVEEAECHGGSRAVPR